MKIFITAFLLYDLQWISKKFVVTRQRSIVEKEKNKTKQNKNIYFNESHVVIRVTPALFLTISAPISNTISCDPGMTVIA